MSRRCAVPGSDLRGATIDHVQAALEVMRVKQDGSPASPATVNMTIAAVKALLGFAHQVGYTRFKNAAPLIKLRKASATALLAMRADASPSARVFPIDH